MSFLSINVPKILKETFVARVEHHEVLGSTNDRARQCAAEADGELPLLILADAQTAGRGRGTNRWWTGRGSLAMSLLVDLTAFEVTQSRSPLVSLAAAVAVVRAVEPALRGFEVGLHWPNDVYAEQRKLAGILVEVLPSGPHIVGIGLNSNSTLAEAPPELRQRAITLRDLTGQLHDHTALVIALLRELAEALETLAYKPIDIARQCNALCLQRGKTLIVQSGEESVRGQCLGIAADGTLCLATPRGQRRFSSGTVTLAR